MAMARSVMILDESLVSLQQPLEAKNFKVYKMESGLQEKQASGLLSHSIYVIPEAFTGLREAAAIHEFSAITTSGTCQDPETLSNQISRAFIEFALKSKQPFLLKLRENGNHVLQPIE
jgi:hypothetical protein